MKTLYRAYRPQNFKEIVNQNHIKITLQHEIESGRTAHAYLFCGPRGIGKTTIARIFAKSLNCQNRKEGEHEPCDVCDMCKDLILGRSMDIIEVDGASHTGVDNVRENIISVARVAPSRSKYKIFIIDEVHMLSISAFNALLKLLEEPPAHAVFVLCTTEVHKIPETIISRTERFDFKRISAKDIIKKLKYIIDKEGVKMAPGVLENIARQSDGHMRDAESLLGQVVAIGGKEISVEEADLVIPRSDINEVLNLIEMLGKKDAGSAIGLVNKALDEGINLKRFISETLEILRKMMLAKLDSSLAGKFGLELGESVELRLMNIGSTINIATLVKIIDRFMRLQNEMKGAFIEQLPFELAIAELSLSEQAPKPKESAEPDRVSPVPSFPNTKIAQAYTTKNTDAQVPIPEKQELVNDEAPQAVPTPISNDHISMRWNELLARIKKHNHSLSFILRACQPRDFKDKLLTLAFKYKFHKDRVSEPGIKLIIENVLEEVYGTNISIIAIIDEKMKVDNNQNPQSTTPTEVDTPSIDNKQAMASQAPSQASTGNTTSGNNNDEDMLNNVLKAFGGKVM